MHSWNDLLGLRVGAVIGRNYPAEFRQAQAQGLFSVVDVVSGLQMFEMLQLGRLDALLSMDLEADEFLQQPRFKGQIVPSQEPYTVYPYYLAISRQSPWQERLPQINQAILELQRNGTLPALLKRYGF